MKKKLLVISIFFLIIGFVSVVNKSSASTAEGTLGTGLQTGLEGVTKAAPTVSPVAGAYTSTQTVTLTASGATKICYTTDGTTTPVCATPTTCTAGTALASGGTVSVAVATTIKSAGCYADASTGPVATSLYTFSCATPTVTNGTVSAYSTCAITCNSGYTLSGSTCNANSSGGGGGGGGGTSASSCTGVTYSAWTACVNGRQTRTVATQTPSGCSLTSVQQIAVSQTCQVASSTDPIIDQDNNQEAPPSSGSSDQNTPSLASKELTAKIMFDEKVLTGEIDQKLTTRLSGRILLQTESFGQAWYVDPVSQERFYLADGPNAYQALRKFGLGIKNSDIIKIPVGLESRFTMLDTDKDGLPDKLEEAIGTDLNKADTDNDGNNDGTEIRNGYNPNGTGILTFSTSLADRLKGRIILQTESRGEAWYVNPVDGKRYYLANGEAAYQIMRYLSLGISNDNIRKITVGTW